MARPFEYIIPQFCTIHGDTNRPCLAVLIILYPDLLFLHRSAVSCLYSPHSTSQAYLLNHIYLLSIVN